MIMMMLAAVYRMHTTHLLHHVRREEQSCTCCHCLCDFETLCILEERTKIYNKDEETKGNEQCVGSDDYDDDYDDDDDDDDHDDDYHDSDSDGDVVYASHKYTQTETIHNTPAPTSTGVE